VPCGLRNEGSTAYGALVGANTLVLRVIDRMPVILPRENWREWLNHDAAEDSLKAMLKPYDSNQMESWPVTRNINKRGFEGPECVEPVVPEQGELGLTLRAITEAPDCVTLNHRLPVPMKRRTFVRDLSLCAASLPLVAEAKLEQSLAPPPLEEGASPWLYAPTPDHCPPDDDVVWTSDGHVVRMGHWTWRPGARRGIWKGTDGRPIMVTHWCFTDDVEEMPSAPTDVHSANLARL
jgi:hypothetical protein